MINPKEVAIAKLISKAWLDDNFRSLLNSNPANVLLGANVSQDEFGAFVMTN